MGLSAHHQRKRRGCVAHGGPSGQPRPPRALVFSLESHSWASWVGSHSSWLAPTQRQPQKYQLCLFKEKITKQKRKKKVFKKPEIIQGAHIFQEEKIPHITTKNHTKHLRLKEEIVHGIKERMLKLNWLETVNKFHVLYFTIYIFY